MNKQQTKHWLIWLIGAGLLVVLAILAWQRFGLNARDKDLVSGNGWIEAVEIGVAVKSAGHVKEILVHEGDLVTAGHAVTTARSQLNQRKRKKAAAVAMVAQRNAGLDETTV